MRRIKPVLISRVQCGFAVLWKAGINGSDYFRFSCISSCFNSLVAETILKMMIVFGFLSVIAGPSMGQITSGKITYERKTNLYKKFKDWDGVKDWIKEGDKSKVDVFELYFNDSLSLFKPQESDLKENFSWATDKNTVYQNLKSNKRFTTKRIWGEEVKLTDTLYKRVWKITDSKRTICGYSSRKAIWQVNDSVRMYAWYCDEISSGFGPESFYGLPGVILGLATEDGSVIYFAKNVDATKQEIGVLLPPNPKGKVYTASELKLKLEKEYGREKWGKAMIKNVFGYW
jgi:GLPGLI family protein